MLLQSINGEIEMLPRCRRPGDRSVKGLEQEAVRGGYGVEGRLPDRSFDKINKGNSVRVRASLPVNVTLEGKLLR